MRRKMNTDFNPFSDQIFHHTMPLLDEEFDSFEEVRGLSYNRLSSGVPINDCF